MSILILGAKGMLASQIKQDFLTQGIDVQAFSKADCSITDSAQLEKTLTNFSGEFVINCAAYTKVDLCEEQQYLANKVNGTAVESLAKLCSRYSKTLIHFSTDYVFDGRKDSPYLEEDKPNPINVYGQSKLLGEQGIVNNTSAYYILRVQWLYGTKGPNFIKSIIGLATEKPTLSIVSDQQGTPTSVRAVSVAVQNFISQQPPFGIYHVGNQGDTTWYGFARYFLEKLKIKTSLTPVESTAFPRPATRPKNGRLNTDKYCQTFKQALPSWQEDVDHYLENIEKE